MTLILQRQDANGDVTTDEAGEKTANNHMQFLHFVEDGDNVKVDMCWAK